MQQLTPGKDLVPIVQEAGWASGPVWTGAENLAFIGIRSPDGPARRQSLYRLRYPAHRYIIYTAMAVGFTVNVLRLASCSMCNSLNI